VSPYWQRGASGGAVTWGNGSIGTSGAVSPDNSQVGNETPDFGFFSINVVPLSNGNYVIQRPHWNNGAATDAGAVTLADGTKAISGAISAANSLVGTSARDEIGRAVTALANGNYVVSSPDWSNGAAARAGAATWVNGRAGLSGEISAANSLVGLYAGDHVASGGVTALRNGNYVVSSAWSLTVPQQIGYTVTPSVGSATWGNGHHRYYRRHQRRQLVDRQPGQRYVGSRVTALSNGDYVVRQSLLGQRPRQGSRRGNLGKVERD
jgi:hypothetical protein